MRERGETSKVLPPSLRVEVRCLSMFWDVKVAGKWQSLALVVGLEGVRQALQKDTHCHSQSRPAVDGLPWEAGE